MALIECSECTRSISDKATACPGCGFPIVSTTTQVSAVIGEDCEQVATIPATVDLDSTKPTFGEFVCMIVAGLGCLFLLADIWMFKKYELAEINLGTVLWQLPLALVLTFVCGRKGFGRVLRAGFARDQTQIDAWRIARGETAQTAPTPIPLARPEPRLASSSDVSMDEAHTPNGNDTDARLRSGKRQRKIILAIAAIMVTGGYGAYLVSMHADDFVAMRMVHAKLSQAPQDYLKGLKVASDKLKIIAAAQPEDGGPLGTETLELIARSNELLNYVAHQADSEITEWDKLDTEMYSGSTLAKRRSMNTLLAADVRNAVTVARTSAALAYADMPTGPHSAVLVQAAANDIGSIESAQNDARYVRERNLPFRFWSERR